MTEGDFESSAPLNVAEGAEARFDRLFRHNFSTVYAYFIRRSRNDDVADLVSEVFVVAWRRLDQVPQAPEDRLWLYGVARRVMSQHARSTLRRTRLAARIGHLARPSPEEAAPDQGMGSRVLELVEHLSPKDREVVKLIVWEGLSHAEVASVLRCSPNAVALRWYRSLKHLRRQLGLSDGSTDPAQVGGT